MELITERYGLTLGEAARRAAHRMPGRTACIDETASYTMSDVYNQACRVANALIAEGLQPGDRVGILMPYRLESMTTMIAVALAGGVTEFLLPQYGSAELVRMLQTAPPHWLLYSAAHTAEVSAIIAEFAPQTAVVEDEAEAPFHWSQLISSGATEPPDVHVSPDSDALILFTSGTTGTPKAVRRSHNSTLSQAVMYMQYLNINNRSVLAGMQVSYEVVPEIIADGGCFVLADMLQPREWLRTIERRRITHTGGVTSLLQLWLSYPDWSEFDLSSLECIAVGSMTVPVELHAQLQARAGIPLTQVYGSIEAGVLAINMLTEGAQLAALGLPVEGKTIRIIGDNGADAASGEIGELVVRATGKYQFGLMSGYVDDALSPWQDGWLHTGDLVYRDDDGYLYLVGRTYETINVAGHKIYAPEVERVLRSHPAVADAAVIGVPDVKRGEVVVAYIVLKPQKSLTLKEIREHCSRTLAPHKLPKRFLFQETLPRTATGKVNKQVLREMAE